MAEFNVYFSKPQKGESTKMTRAIQAKRAKFARELARKKERELISEDELNKILRKRIVPYSYEGREPGVGGSRRVLTMKEKEREAKKEEEKRYKDMKKRAMERLLDLETKAEKDIYRGEKEARKLEREAREMRESMLFREAGMQTEPRETGEASMQTEPRESVQTEPRETVEISVQTGESPFVLFTRLRDMEPTYKATDEDFRNFDARTLNDLNLSRKELDKIAKMYGISNNKLKEVNKQNVIPLINDKVDEHLRGKGLFSKKSKSTKSTKLKHPEEGSPFKHLFDLHLPKTTSKSTKAKK
jgi:hypothetical protein